MLNILDVGFAVILFRAYTNTKQIINLAAFFIVIIAVVFIVRNMESVSRKSEVLVVTITLAISLVHA